MGGQARYRLHTKVIACTTVIEEMLPLLPPDVDYRVLDFGLHVNPEALKRALQQAIDAWATSAEAILLGYGLCSQAVVGLRANDCTLVVPRGRALLVGSKSPKLHLGEEDTMD